eukprot:798458_1
MNKPTKKEDNPWWQYLESNDNQMDDDGVYQELIQNAGVFRWQCPHGFASGEHQGLMHLKPKYKNAKEEALHNTYNQLSVDSWNQTIRKSEQFNRSFARRRIKTKSKGKFEDQIVGVCSQWRQGDDIDLGEIVTLKLYTDFDKLQFQLKKCLRFDSNTDECAALENSNRLREFFHWRHNLLTVLSKFGSTLTEKKLLYHGVNAKMILYNGRCTQSTFYGPLSTSSSYHVARTFATMKGMVLCVATQYPRLGMCRAFNASLLSDYPEEQEWLIGFIYMRVLQVITRPLHRSWNTFKDMDDGMDEIPLSSKARSIFAMDVHSEQCKYPSNEEIHFINAYTLHDSAYVHINQCRLRKIHFLNNYRFNNEALAGLKNDIWGVRVTESLFMMKNTDDAFQRIMNGKSVQLWLSWINLMFISVSLWRYQMSSRLSQPNDNYIFF